MSNQEKPAYFVTAEDELKQDEWWLLKKIKRLQYLDPGKTVMIFFEENDKVSSNMQTKLLHKLNREGILDLEINTGQTFDGPSFMPVNLSTGLNTFLPSNFRSFRGFRLTINQQKFDKRYEELSQTEKDEQVAGTWKEGAVARIKSHWLFKYILGSVVFFTLIIDFFTNMIGVVRFIISFFKFSG
ncbi:MAG TPA: hypothetical protein ACFYD6_12210 [Candidatus Brocadiia bacterium]|nr:hypothetical protein [Candidatus Brocadiales bacterium]